MARTTATSSTVGAVISRGEFLTAYTPYQPEESQGDFQTIYEFQSMVAELYGTDIANASMYDGATSMAEAAIMANGVNGRPKTFVSGAVHPTTGVCSIPTCGRCSSAETLPATCGATDDFDAVDESAACVIVQYPNFGNLEDLNRAREAARRTGALFIVVADPVACALVRPPGEFDADVVVGEGQPMGIAMGFGGPLLGLFACKSEFVRRIPGRIVGRTKEAHGEREGYVMTLRTREQDIRREKATSNICTNQALMALASTVYMSALGKNGMRQVAEATVRNTQYALGKLKEAGARRRFDGKVFGEFTLELPRNAAEVRDRLLEQGILAGLPLGTYYEGMENCLLVAVTELRTREQIDDFSEKLRAVLR